MQAEANAWLGSRDLFSTMEFYIHAAVGPDYDAYALSGVLSLDYRFGAGALSFPVGFQPGAGGLLHELQRGLRLEIADRNARQLFGDTDPASVTAQALEARWTDIRAGEQLGVFRERILILDGFPTILIGRKPSLDSLWRGFSFSYEYDRTGRDAAVVFSSLKGFLEVFRDEVPQTVIKSVSPLNRAM